MRKLVKGWGPYIEVREKVRGLADDDIGALSFLGPSFGDFTDTGAFDKLLVTDRGLIHRFMEALRGAEWEDPLAFAPEYALILLGPRLPSGEWKTIQHAQREFRYRPLLPHTTFGPMFMAALRELGRFRAAETRQAIEVRAWPLTMAAFPEQTIRAPETLETIARALCDLDERAFAYTGTEQRTMIDLTFADGVYYRVALLIPQPEIYLASHELDAPPLPAALWHFFPRHQKAYREYLRTVSPDARRRMRDLLENLRAAE